MSQILTFVCGNKMFMKNELVLHCWMLNNIFGGSDVGSMKYVFISFFIIRPFHDIFDCDDINSVTS